MRIHIKDNEKADLFVQCFQHIKTFTESVNIMFNETELYVQSMDHAMVMISEMKLPYTWFDEYILTDEVSVTLGVNTGLWSKVLSLREKSQTILLDTSGSDDHLLVKFTSSEESNEKTKSFDKEFVIPLIDLESDLMQIPETEYQADITMTSSNLAGIITQLKQFGDTFHVFCNENELKFFSESDVFGKMIANVSVDDVEEFAIGENCSVSTQFPLKQLHVVSLYQKVSKNVVVSLTENVPICVIYSLEGGGSIKFYIAPKIDD